ncbi:MAG TPA: SDR family oxidoreductase [Mycobacteriales bacterium]|nr:SDR family oxidoreductase [Mycobacteriales bacterium]
MTQLRDALLEGKAVLVSGGTQGLGAAVAAAAARNGARVAVTGRRKAVGEEFAAALSERSGQEIAYVPADAGDVGQVQAAVAATVERFGRIDCLVNCAGLTTRGSILDTTPELFDDHIAVNVRGPFFLMQAAIKDMVARGTGGAIVNIITMSAHGGQPYLAPYVASKSGLVGLTRNAAFAHRWDRIRINGINIGWTETEGEDVIQRRFHGAADDWLRKASAGQPMGKLGQVDEIADFVVFLLSARSGVVTGSVIDWDQVIPGAYE